MQNTLERRLSLKQLRAIEAIDRCGSLSQAALNLFLTQPALSKSLHEAEDALGIRIFDRHARGVSRTPDGEGAVRVARAVLSQLRRLEDELDQARGPAPDTVVLGGAAQRGAGPVAGDPGARVGDGAALACSRRRGRDR